MKEVLQLLNRVLDVLSLLVGAPDAPEVALSPISTPIDLRQPEEVCMDENGNPTLFRNRCGICGELGRNSRSHQEEVKDGTHHWVVVE